MSLAVDVTCASGRCVVVVTGTYGHGSAGNGDARVIEQAVDVAIARHGAVTLDLSRMGCEWGDSVANVVLDERVVEVLLSSECAQAWNGLLSFANPMWPDELGHRIRFVSRSRR